MVTATPVHGGTPPAGSLVTPFSATAAICSTWYAGALTECMPNNFDAYWSGRELYYSPGICPLSWTNAGQPSPGFGPNIEATETVMVCCPSGWDYIRGSACTTQYTTTSANQAYLTQTLAFALQVRWASSDLSLLATDPLTSGKLYSKPTATGQSSSVQVTESSSGPTNTPSLLSNSSNNGLSTAAKVGLGVGIPLALCLGALIVILLVHRKSKKAKDKMEYRETLPSVQVYPKWGGELDSSSPEYKRYDPDSLPPNVEVGSYQSENLERSNSTRNNAQYLNTLNSPDSNLPEVVRR